MIFKALTNIIFHRDSWDCRFQCDVQNSQTLCKCHGSLDVMCNRRMLSSNHADNQCEWSHLKWTAIDEIINPLCTELVSRKMILYISYLIFAPSDPSRSSIDKWGPDTWLTHWYPDKMAAISQAPFSNAFSWMKKYIFRLWFHWILFLRFELRIFQHWFRSWLGADQATSHYLNQWWLTTDAYIRGAVSMS